MKTNKLTPTLLVLSVLVAAVFVSVVVGSAARYCAAVSGTCAAKPVSTNTFIKTFRMRDRAPGYGMLPTKDGGYLVTGDTVLSSGMGVWNAFVVKTDAKGAAVWSKQFDSESAAQGVLTETERLSAQTTDGNFVVAGDIKEFYDEAYGEKKELWGDVMVTKMSTGGVWMWSTMVGDYSMDFPQRLWASADGGVLLLAKLKKMTGTDTEVADVDAVPDYSVVVKFDSAGKVLWSKKMSFAATDMEYLSDGSFIALANIETSMANVADSAMVELPAIIKLDSKLKVLWAKSIEAPSLELATVTGTTRETMKIGKTKMRIAGGDFRSVEQTADGGYIAFGRYFNAAQLLGGNRSAAIKSLTDAIPSVAVKVDAKGAYKWAKSVKTPFASMDLDLKAVKTTNNEFVLSRNIMRDAKFKTVTDMANNVELMKVDANFNPRWVKKIDIERDTEGYDLRATSDGGVAISGRIITVEEHMIMGSPEPWQDAFLLKADANGDVSGAKVVATITQATVADESSVLIMQAMSVITSDFKLPINQSVKPKITDIEDKQRTIVAPAVKSVTPVCTTLNVPTTGTTPATGAGSTEPQTTSYAKLSFDNAVEGKIETEKSRKVNDELLPILKKVFGQVKMTDNQDGLWLTYYFPRQATVADREAVQKEVVALGYKVDEAEGGVLNVSKVGVSLRMTFSVNNSMVGKLEVML
ncbi:MAG: hypothetical protein WCS85_01270 [Candidatus Peribacteraceae bacterium]